MPADLNGDGFEDLVGTSLGPGRTMAQPPAWMGTATPGVFRRALARELPPRFTELTPVKIGNETFLVSSVSTGDSGKTLTVRAYRRVTTLQ